MFKPKQGVDALINNKSHIQKKYFSLMLVPSYASGKTRSVRIPYALFYFVIISVLVTSATIAGFYVRSSYYERQALSAGESLNKAREAYSELQSDFADEQSRLLNSQDQLKEQLSEAEMQSQLEKIKQSEAYQQNLEGLREKVADMERVLDELDAYRQSELDKLGASAYIPPVKSLFDEVNNKFAETRAVFLSSAQPAQVFNAATEEGLRGSFALFDVKAETLRQSFAELDAAFAKAQPYIENYPTIWPVSGKISSQFGARANPMGGRGREYHDALDISCRTGTEVKAAGGGTVKSAGWLGTYGYMVVIDHGFGMQTAYAHNSKLLVSKGDTVARGDVIAKSGSTGRSTGPHLHYEVRVNGVTANPENFLLK